MNDLIQIIFSTKYYLGEFQRDNFKTNKRKKRNASFIRCYLGRKYPTCQFPHHYVCNLYVCANPYIWKVVSLTYSPTLLNKNAEDVSNPSWQLGGVTVNTGATQKIPCSKRAPHCHPLSCSEFFSLFLFLSATTLFWVQLPSICWLIFYTQ